MSIWLPTFPSDRIKRRSPDTGDRPLLLSAQDRQRQVVAACCERASAVGVRPGMPIAQARALFDADGVTIESHRADRDRAALRGLAVWAQRFSPVVAVDEPCGLMVDVTGCGPVFDGDAGLLAEAFKALGMLGFRSRVAIAPTFGSAWALARYGRQATTIVAQADLQASLKPLAVAALRLDAATVRALGEIGIERIDQLLELPRSTLPGRFGGDLLLRLDQAIGQAIETIEPIRPVPPPSVERVFEGPTDRIESIEYVVRELIFEISALLLAQHQGARQLRIELARSDLPPEQLSVTLGHPSADAQHLWTLVRPKVERAHLGFGVEAVHIRVAQAGPLCYQQAEQWSDGQTSMDAPDEQACKELIDTLINRLGTDRVLRVSLRESHIPEHAFEWCPAICEKHQAKRTNTTFNDRPTVLLDPPIDTRVVALTPDGPIHRVCWQHAETAVISCIGPERIAHEWWRGRRGTRDYFRIQTEQGEWLWVACVLETGRWFVHGVWA